MPKITVVEINRNNPPALDEYDIYVDGIYIGAYFPGYGIVLAWLCGTIVTLDRLQGIIDKLREYERR